MNYAILEVEEYTIYYYATGEGLSVQLQEAKHRGRPLRGPYSYRKDGPHSPVGQNHIHVFRSGNELFALNWTGTAHDQSHGKHIPNKVAAALRQLFPDLVIPSNNFIESGGGYFDFLAGVLSE